jgi:putative alpha-1,2-mannosidase
MKWLAAVAFTLANSQPVPSPVDSVWPFHGTSGAGGLGGWASSEVPIGASVPFGGLRLGPDTTVCWGGADWWWKFNHGCLRTHHMGPHNQRP